MSLESATYETISAKLQNRGIIARYVVDSPPEATYMDLLNCYSREEGAIASTFGRLMITTNGTSNVPLTGFPVHSLGRLKGLGSNNWRYAASQNSLFRRSGTTAGAYTNILNGSLSGSRMSMVEYRPNNSSTPFMFFADLAQMQKDNGSFSATQNWGILPPVWPVSSAIASAPLNIQIELFEANTGFTYNPADAPAINARVNTTVANGTTPVGIFAMQPASMANILPGCMLKIDSGGNLETVQVLSTTTTTFTAQFTKTHANGVAIVSNALQYTAAVSSTSNITKNFSTSLAAFAGGVATQAADIFNLYVNVDVPANLVEIHLLFDVGDGSFADYYIKTIAPTDIQSFVDQTSTASTSLQTRLLDRASGQVDIRGPQAQGLGQFGDILPIDDPTLTGVRAAMLLPGSSTWSRIQARLGEFVAVGQAGAPNHTWANVSKFRISIQTNAGGAVIVQLDDLYLFGGSGPDSFGGTAYDYVYTFYNINTGAESNPSQFMNPSNFCFAYRQPITISLYGGAGGGPDSQITHFRVYRRGGSLTANYQMVAQVAYATSSVSYVDTVPDSTAQLGQILSLTNNAPVTSILPVPVNTTLGTNISAFGQATVTPASMASISGNQLVTIDANTPNQETVVVISTTLTQFTAFFQFTHTTASTVQATTKTAQPLNLAAEAFERIWLAGDPNNPHYLYYSNRFQPESVPAANFLEIGTSSDPIMGIVKFWSQLFVFTLSTVYQVLGADTAVPIPLPTSTTHGLRAQFAWAVGEGEIFYLSNDGIYAFRGGDAEYMTRDIEWVFRGQNLGPIPPIAPYENFSAGDLTTSIMAYYNNQFFFAYTDINGDRRRLIYSTTYKRWRDDAEPAYSMLFEKDLADLVFGDGAGAVYQDQVGNFFDAGFIGGVQQFAPMSVSLQTASLDQNLPKNNKVYNEFTVDIDTGGIPVTLTLLYNNQTQSLPLGTVTSNGRAQFPFNINAGDGLTSLNIALKATATIQSNVAIQFFEIHIRYFVEAELRKSFDSYWTALGEEGFKFVKQGWIEYNAPDAAGITFNVYTEGNMTVPAYTFTLPQTSGRFAVQVRFPALMARLWRWVATSPSAFQLYEDRSYIEGKASTTQKGYAKMKMAA